MNQKFTSSSAKILIPIALCIFILLLPTILNVNKTLPGDTSYYNIRIANQIQEEKSIPTYDELSYGGRHFVSQPGYPVVLAITSSISQISLEELSKYLPIIFGVLSIILFYLILKKLKVENRILISIILILSPSFIYLFTISNQHFIPIFLSLLAFLSFLNQKKILTSIILILIPFFSIANSLIGLFLLFIYILMKDRKKIKWFLLTLLLILITLSIYYLPILKGLPELVKFEIGERGINFAFQNLISDLGGKFGVGIFALLLSLFGLKELWVNKKKNIIIYLVFISLILITLYFNIGVLYLNFLLSGLAAIGLLGFKNVHWESKVIKNLTIIILAVGLILSGVSKIGEIANSQPTADVISSLEFLKIKSNENDVVFSSHLNGFWINTLANRKNVMDSNVLYAPDVNQRYIDSQILLHTRNKEVVNEIIEKYNIKFIWINREMKEGEVWKTDKDGLIYILKNTIGFELLYQSSNTEVWKVL